ncbi:hypothetical protein BBJ28_00007788 [Nothophytophthora sp. Chile5]|nr:hypothetical protein BBJ28_00007788 [Nothophytophthora sp. Chile5]
MWLLRRHETQRLREVERLRGALRTAATRVVTKNCVLYVKRRAIHDYLDHFTAFEARLDGLLGQVLIRKRRKEEERRLVVIRRQHVQRIEEQKRQVVRNWLAIRIEESRQRREQQQAVAHAKLLAWVRRWKLKTRCQARVIAREQQQRREAQRDRSAQHIAAFYRTAKRRYEAKLELQRCIRIRNGLTRLSVTLRLALLRTAQSRWQMRLIELKQAEVAIRTLQQLYRKRQAAAGQAHRSVCCVTIQRLFRGHLARALCSRLRRQLQHEAETRRRHAAATQLQRRVRGLLARRRFAEMVHKLRERFRCANCGVLEPSGEYCKYCGRRRSTFGPLSSLLLPSEKPLRPIAVGSTADENSMLTMDVSVPIVPPAKYQTGRRRHTRPRCKQPRVSWRVPSLKPFLNAAHSPINTRAETSDAITFLRLSSQHPAPFIMGNSPLTRDFSGRRMTLEEREAMKRFGDEEMQLLRETFKGLASGNDGSSVDKETFLKCFPMRGLLGERLFEVIDKDGSGSIHYNEFVYGLAILFRGSQKEKLKFIFDLYDLSECAFAPCFLSSRSRFGVVGTQQTFSCALCVCRAGSISRHELLTILHQFPESALELIKPTNQQKETSRFGSIVPQMEEIEGVVDLAFPPPCSNSARLTFEQFSRCVLPVEEQAVGAAPSGSGVAAVTPVSDNLTLAPMKTNNVGAGDPLEPRKKHNSFANLHVTRSSPRLNMIPGASMDGSSRKELEKTRSLLQEAKAACSIESVASKIQLAITEIERLLSTPSSSTTSRGSFTSSGSSPTPSTALDDLPGATVVEESSSVSGDLWKRGSRLRQMIKRHYVLQGNFLYYYATPDDTAPRGVTFLCDCYVESQSAQAVIVEKGARYFGVDIVPEPGSSREKRTVFTRSPEDQKRWAAALRQATNKVSIEEVYDVGAQLGRGRFSKVCEATHKLTGAKTAVKIIDKIKLQAAEKELLRTEIAILKLVRHPNLVRLHDVYEDKQYMYLVTELVTGGELFNRIVGRARYTEAEARLVMRPLLESVSYLHRLGIVHRDLKPENILCGEALTDLKIADFGLSKLAHPEELLKMPCGTLNYVAPEVLALVGYGREADIWSLGVILFLLLRGELPFYGKTKSEVIQKTLHAEINLEADATWRSVSPAGKALLRGLLSKDPARRLTAQDALQHEWFTPKSPRLSVNSASGGGLVASPPEDSQH